MCEVSSLSIPLYFLIALRVKSDTYLADTLYTGRAVLRVSQCIVPAIFFPRLYGLFIALGERLSRMRWRPKLAWNPQNAGRTPLSCKDECRFSIKRRLRLMRKGEISSINAPTRFPDRHGGHQPFQKCN